MSLLPRTEPLSERERCLIDVVKDSYQSSRQSGQVVCIEDLWQSFPESMQLIALAELLLLEFRLRRAADDTFSLADYSQRFPGQSVLIADLFAQDAASDSTPATIARLVETTDFAETLIVGLSPDQPNFPKVTVTLDEKLVPQQFGRYQIERELGRGGMGAVYLALDEQLDRKVAIKIPFFKDEEDRVEAVERFYREARAMATVRHANLCPVFDVGQFEQWHFLTMAFIDGQTLADKLKEAGSLPVIQAVTLMKTVALAMQNAHEAGIVHRDLKPSNIMLTSDLEPIIMDFGLARRQREGEVDLTSSGTIMGSPSYMSPEQVESRLSEIGPATDVWAMGVILYQMLAGKRPFEGSVASIFGQIVSCEPEPPSSLQTEVSPELDAVCLKAMSKSPSQRQASAAELAKDLSQSLAPSGEASVSIHLELNSGITSSQSMTIGRGETVSVSRSRREVVRRQVTVAIFNYEADDSSLNQSSGSHSELLHQQSQSFAAFISERVAQLGGVTVPSSGQEVIACFGFPQAVDDAPQRAVRVALQVMRDLATSGASNLSLPSATEAWVVVHVGEAAVEERKTLQGMEVSLAGEAHSTATRLSTVAEPGMIVISSVTHQQIGSSFECKSLGERRVRGLAQPVELFKVAIDATSS